MREGTATQALAVTRANRRVTVDTFGRHSARVDNRVVSRVDAKNLKDALMRKATTFLRRFVTREPSPGPGWWAYFGSFGDDMFGDEA